jgi:hypothetical protein
VVCESTYHRFPIPRNQRKSKSHAAPGFFHVLMTVTKMLFDGKFDGQKVGETGALLL